MKSSVINLFLKSFFFVCDQNKKKLLKNKVTDLIKLLLQHLEKIYMIMFRKILNMYLVFKIIRHWLTKIKVKWVVIKTILYCNYFYTYP